ncbi:hypothetical protein DFH07DRAFT_578493 [Mycena maculata]|uniref:Glycosyltransferase family 18 catalytic domain-containing protein n=1 Tax=Mycena maculata TaxID=230809 RepID=A0AAD7IR63_9AGAR|nr:hypothetical protein DFH07DRAFT_578493 [Mycena maculata]
MALACADPRNRGTRIALLFLAFTALLCIYLTWNSIQSRHSTIAAQFTQPSVTLLTNNDITYPRQALDALSPQKAREFIDRLDAIRDVAFSPHYEFMNVHNLENVDRLLQYLERVEDGERLPAPRVVLSSWHFLPTCYEESSNGEVQWMRPLLELMQEQDIFIIYAAFPDKTFHTDFYLLGNDLITHAWMDDEHLIWCFQDPHSCMQSERNLEGIPLWKMFAFTFWGSLPRSGKWLPPPTDDTSWSFNPLGREWNLVPYQMPEGHFYIGYHYERCQALQYVPFAQRPDQIVVLAKKSEYFHNNALLLDPSTFYTRLKNATGYHIVSNARVEDGYPIPEGLNNIGLLPQAEYDLQLANTKALLGIGKPQISPTPYASLCRGVPVIIPYRSDTGCPARPGPNEYCGFYAEIHQHGPAAAIGEPYIYTVDVTGPVEDIIQTIQRAVNTPIEPFEPEEMTKGAVRQRLLDYFDVDWEAHGEAKGFGTEELVLPPWLIDWSRRNPDPTLH